MTKQDYKNKVLQQFNEKFSKWEGSNESFAPLLNAERDVIKSFLSKSIDEAIELAFRECEVKEIKEILDFKEELTEREIGFNEAVSERSRLEKLFKGE